MKERRFKLKHLWERFSKVFLHYRYIANENLLEDLNELKDKNEQLNNLEILQGNSLINSFPPFLEIEFTNACNLRCFMCYQSNHKVKYTQMNDETLSHVISILPYVKTILIAGLGEQLLYQKLGNFLKIADHYHCRVRMFSNGHLIHQNLDIFKHVSKLTISFDGATKEVFEAQRYGANFKKVISNIKLLRKTHPELKITLGCVVSKLNIHQIEQVVQIAVDLGVDAVAFPHVQHSPMIALTKDDHEQLKQQIEKALNLANRNGLEISYRDFEYIKNTSGDKAPIKHHELIEDVNNESKHREQITPKDIPGLSDISSSTNSLGSNIQRSISAMSFEIKKEIRRLDKLINEAEGKINTNLSKSSSIPNPYCLSPWTYAFIKMTGNFRLCPYYDLEAGNIKMSVKGLNEENLVKIRASLATKNNMIDKCETCPDFHHRRFNYSVYKETCGKYGFTINEI